MYVAHKLGISDARVAAPHPSPPTSSPPQLSDSSLTTPSTPHSAPMATSLFLSHNEALVPPYRILVDTNFINLSLENRIDMVKAMMDTLYAKAIPCISDCVIAELEKLGQKYRLALRMARDPRFERLPCAHKGTYADDCIVNRVTSHRCYIVATCDRQLRRRIRKVPGVPVSDAPLSVGEVAPGGVAGAIAARSGLRSARSAALPS